MTSQPLEELPGNGFHLDRRGRQQSATGLESAELSQPLPDDDPEGPPSNAQRLREAARNVFGWDQLRAEQLEAMQQVMAGHDVLVVMPTGSGKSAIYQVPTLLIDGPTLIVSPLLALQRDQIRALAEAGAPKAVAINSTNGTSDRRRAWTAVARGDAEYLFLAPEQLAREDVIERLRSLGVGLIVVDEAHCVSAWGHDFRPDYLRLAPVIAQLGHPPVLAMTATAARPVRSDIAERLGLRDPVEVVGSFDRPNLHLSVQQFLEDGDKRAAVIDRVKELVTVGSGAQRGLVYTASRKDAEQYSGELRQRGLRAIAYHAGMKAADRDDVHRRFLADEVDIVVATSAFGMGIDKPDVRFVVHASVPDSLDSYYQEIGRAGRDGEPAGIALLYRPEDLALQRFLTSHGANEDALRQVAGALQQTDQPLTLRELGTRTEVAAARRTRAVNLLEQAGVVITDDTGRVGYRAAAGDLDAAVSAAMQVAENRQQLVRSRIEMMRGYAETTGCRRQFLLGYFGEQLTDPCGKCDNCDAGTAEPDSAAALPANSPVHHLKWGHGVVMSVDSNRLTVLFDDVGYKTLSATALTDGILSTDPATVPHDDRAP